MKQPQYQSGNRVRTPEGNGTVTAKSGSTAIPGRPGGEAVYTVRLDDGRAIECKESELSPLAPDNET